MKRFRPLLVLESLALGLACSAGVKGSDTSGGGGGGGNGGTGVGPGTGSGGSSSVLPPPSCGGACMDFPPNPIIVDGAPDGAPGMFGDPSAGGAGGPCLLEPQVGALFPNNWLRPRFRLKPAAGQSLFEIRRSEEHTSELQSLRHLVCRLLLE